MLKVVPVKKSSASDQEMCIRDRSENVYSVEDFESADDMWEALGEHNICLLYTSRCV